MIPGEIDALRGRASIELNAGPRRRVDASKVDQHRRPADPGRLALSLLRDQRRAALRSRARRYGFRLNIAAGTAVRFEPGQTRTVELVALAGDRKVYGFQGKVMGALEANAVTRSPARPTPRCTARRRATACASADTELWIEVEKDFTIYGEEVKFGGGKVIRDGMGQSQRVARGGRRHGDHQRAHRRPLGHRQGRHRPQGRPHLGIGKAGNPDIQPGVDDRDRRRAPKSSPAKA